MKHIFRMAKPADAEALLAIYAPYITDTAVSFEAEVPAVREFAERIAAISAKYPYLVCEIDGAIAGYAYASRHRERAAYLFDVDTSIYVSAAFHGTGIARQLYSRLLKLLRELGYRNAYAGITEGNERSVRFHDRFGFAAVGVYHKTGYKLGKWHDVTWFEKQLNDYIDNPADPLPIHEIPAEKLNGFLMHL